MPVVQRSRRYRSRSDDSPLPRIWECPGWDRNICWIGKRFLLRSPTDRFTRRPNFRPPIVPNRPKQQQQLEISRKILEFYSAPVCAFWSFTVSDMAPDLSLGNTVFFSDRVHDVSVFLHLHRAGKDSSGSGLARILCYRLLRRFFRRPGPKGTYDQTVDRNFDSAHKGVFRFRFW